VRRVVKKPSRKAIHQLLSEWGELAEQRRRIEAARDEQLAPIRAKFAKQCAPVEQETAAQLQPVEQRLGELRGEIELLLKAGVSEDGSVALAQVETETATAIVETKSQRTIEPSEFLQFVPERQRDAAFFGCLSVQIGKTEKYLGSKIDQLARLKFTHTVKVMLKGGQ
jgi:hypothetical protein